MKRSLPHKLVFFLELCRWGQLLFFKQTKIQRAGKAMTIPIVPVSSSRRCTV